LGTFSTSEFATLLDELIAEKAREEDVSARPSMPFGFVAPEEAVETLWASVPHEFVAGLYGQTDGKSDGASDEKAFVPDAPGIETPEPMPPLPSIDPAAIADELKTAHARGPKDFDRLRREFALANHPDKVEPRLRERALVRMQIANMLIDNAKRAAASSRAR
jgi:hypothetical protein